MENSRELVDEFEGRLSKEVRRREETEKRWKVKLNPNAEEFRRSKLSGKYLAKMLYE